MLMLAYMGIISNNLISKLIKFQDKGNQMFSFIKNKNTKPG